MKIQKIAGGVNVSALWWALAEHPELWNRNPERTAPENSPHNGLSDIVVRYGKDLKNHGPHESVWYPSADIIPVKPLVYELAAAVLCEQLGGVLITRIPPGAACKPHVDGGWHALNYEKFAVQIASAPGQTFCFEGESLETKPGDVFWFDNQHTHWVTNPTPYERITLIITLKRGG
jgi:hypothetical protein